MPRGKGIKPGQHRLNDEHRAFLIREFACFSSAAEAQRNLLEKYGVELSINGVMYYDPESPRAKKKLSKRWKELYRIEREAFIEHAEHRIPHAFKAVRIRELSEAAEHFKKRGNYMAMADMLERIAKEVGNVHSNRREITGKDGKPVQYEQVGEMTDDALKQEIAQILGLAQDDADIHPAPGRTQ